MQARSASARGGHGGEAGASDPEFGRNGDAGRGGNARATGAAGMSADEMGGAAQKGGNAEARAGDGGFGPLTLGADGKSHLDPFRWGAGGDAFATGGRGGDGGVPSPDGADGGTMLTRHGLTTVERDANIGPHTVLGGRGGDGLDACTTEEVSIDALIRVLTDPALSDQFLFRAGSGGISVVLARIFGDLNKGGKGGDGGEVEVAPGVLGAAATTGRVHLVITNAGNGGDGGDGAPPGAGGSDGLRSVFDNPVIDSETGSFMGGKSGAPCASLSPSPSSLSVTLGGRAANMEARPITFQSADTRWVTVTGTLNDDNTFTATGRGIVAGTPDVLVEFAGTYDPATGALVGDYTMDSEKIIDPNHPILYRVAADGT